MRMFFSVTLTADEPKVIEVKRYARVVDVLRSELDDMVNDFAWSV